MGLVALLVALAAVLALMFIGVHTGSVKRKSRSDQSQQTSGVGRHRYGVDFENEYQGWTVAATV